MPIETVTHETFEQVLPLIAAYQRFYETEPNEERNRTHFGQFLDDHSRGIMFVMLDQQRMALGFATIYFPLSSTQAGTYCLMNDLYTIPEARGQGVGRALINHCLEYGKQRGFSAISWQTAQSNATAQRLYDSTGARQTAWYRYVLPVEK